MVGAPELLIRKNKKPDISLVRDQLRWLQGTLLTYGVEAFCEAFFWIVTKKLVDFTSLVSFKFNLPQRHIEAHLGRNNLSLKGRQEGSTTYFGIRRLLLPAITNEGIGALLISQNSEYAEKHFRILKRAYRYFGVDKPFGAENRLAQSLKRNVLHTAYSNRRELVFDQIDSMVMVASAEVEESAQGPTLHHILADEYSRWPGNPENTLANVRGALVPGGTLDKACTANGRAGAFWQDVLRAKEDAKNSDSVFHFHAWYYVDEYTLEDELTLKQRKELEDDLTADELRLIANMHKELSEVAYLR